MLTQIQLSCMPLLGDMWGSWDHIRSQFWQGSGACSLGDSYIITPHSCTCVSVIMFIFLLSQTGFQHKRGRWVKEKSYYNNGLWNAVSWVRKERGMEQWQVQQRSRSIGKIGSLYPQLAWYIVDIWTGEQFTQKANKPFCPIARRTVSIFREVPINSHFNQDHTHWVFYSCSGLWDSVPI